MAIFDLEVYWPGVTADAAAELAVRVQAAVDQLTAAGRPLRFVGATLSIHDEVCFVRLEGVREGVEKLAHLAGLADVRISEVLVLPGDSATRPE